MIAPGFGGINLEDIAAPRCFEIEARLRASLDIPVFHDDQHGTAIVVLAALTNALRVVEKQLADVRVVVAGAGAAGTAIVSCCIAGGRTDVVVCDREGALAPATTPCPPRQGELAARTNPRRVRGDLRDALHGADVFIGVSAPRVLEPEWIDDHGARGRRLRAGQPRPRGRPRRGREVRRRRGQRALRLPQPDQQRAGVPRRLPRPARRARHRDHHRHAAAGRRTPSPTSSATTSSTRTSSSPRSSTPTCRSGSPPRSRASRPTDARFVRGCGVGAG